MFHFQQRINETQSRQRRFSGIYKHPLDRHLLKSFNLFKLGHSKDDKTSIGDAKNFPSPDPRRFSTR